MVKSMAKEKYSFSEIKEAYLKFKSYIYYDTHNLLTRAELAKFESEGNIEEKLSLLTDSINSYVEKNIKPSYVFEISYWILPKEIAFINNENSEKNIGNSNIISNVSFSDDYEFKRPTYLIKCPIEIHIISVLWILKVGYLLEKSLPISPYGYKLYFGENGKIEKGLKLFELYFNKYQQWRDRAIQSAKNLAKEKKNALIIGLDIKDYYHSVRFNFKEINDFLKEKKNDIGEYKKLTDLLEIVHKNYFKQIQHTDNSNEKFLLPIGLLSSGVIGNWYLHYFDKAVIEEVNPIYYGRYVDDILMVISNSKRENISEIQTIIDIYFKKHKIITYDENKKSKTFFILPDVYKDAKLLVQEKKINILYFDHKEPIAILEKFSQEIRKNSSEFRFLPVEDEIISDFNEEAYSINYSGSKFKLRSIKEFNEDKFGISKFLAKNIFLSQKSLKQSNPEIRWQILRFFRGKRTLDFRELWEKVLTYFLINNQTYEFKKIIQEAIYSIENLKKGNEEKINNLIYYLKQSIYITLSLNPSFVKGKILYNELRNYFPSFSEEFEKYVFYYRKSNMIRHNYVVFPLLNYTKQSLLRDKPLNLSSIDLIDLFKSRADLNLDNQFYYYSPRFVHFHEIATFIFFTNIFNYKTNLNELNFFSSYLENAFDEFYKINYCHDIEINKKGNETYNKIKKQFFLLAKPVIDDNIIKTYIPFHIEIDINNSICKKKLNVALANFRINDYILSHKYLRNPVVKKDRINNIYQLFNDVRRESIKDKSSKVDFFVLPEISIPLILLDNIIRFSLKEKIVSVFGIEHIVNTKKFVFNIIVTLLPVKLDKYDSLIPIFRLKNHYSPEEKRVLEGYGFKIPKLPFAYYYLFKWSNISFTTFNCYELANILHRASFKSKVDLIVASEFNSDINYFSNIVESASREIHCYFIQSNNAKYGDSRITQPAKTEKKDILKIKGGRNYAVIIDTIDIEKLREFQLLNYNLQRDKRDEFKPTPPAFDKEKVLFRTNSCK